MSKLAPLLIFAIIAVAVAVTPSAIAGRATSSQSLSAEVAPGISWQDDHARGEDVRLSRSQITYQGQTVSIVIAYSAGS